MVKLRLQRRGAKKKAFYRIVAMDERDRRDGRFLEQLGHYDPKIDPPEITEMAQAANVKAACCPAAATDMSIRRISQPKAALA